MCKVLDAREKRGIEQGMKQGMKQGASQIHQLMCILAEIDYSMEEILAMTAKEEDRDRLCRKYEIV